MKFVRQLARLEASPAGHACVGAWRPLVGVERARPARADEYVTVDVVVQPLREPGQFPPEIRYEERFTVDTNDLGWVIDPEGGGLGVWCRWSVTSRLSAAPPITAGLLPAT